MNEPDPDLARRREAYEARELNRGGLLVLGILLALATVLLLLVGIALSDFDAGTKFLLAGVVIGLAASSLIRAGR